ncbi:MAG TPA: glycosyl hydrolase family 10 [Cyanobacteria bacterium UBA8803]|nr:glycosyl hydrolase family 10 [Cyanobacteria bacterium UBA9273]HBL60866.1 glycosyl hydrolase family 10 [Cyanobacteria bacterium UBA8803]
MTRRRAFLWGMGLLAGMGTFTVVGGLRHWHQQTQAIDNQVRDFSVKGDTPLGQRALAKGLIYGAAANYTTLSSDAEFSARFIKECGLLVPENELKWDTLRPSPDRFDFTQSDWLAQFAQNQGMLLRGHTLVWHEALPGWFKSKVNHQNAEKFLSDHIKTVVGRYAGKMHSWDVVNEAIELPDDRPDGLRKSPWFEVLGPDYIDLAFRLAAEADPKALLVYNENRLEAPKFESRRTSVLKLLERLKSKGTPVQALGMQSHIGNATWNESQAKNLRNFLKDVASLGLKILITEMDVIDEDMPLDTAVRDRLVAGVYEDFLSIVLDEPAVIAVLTWGLSDRSTWISNYKPRNDGAPVRPLPLDAELNRKLAWNAIARAFDRAPKRNPND